jgi:hypothetical protein
VDGADVDGAGGPGLAASDGWRRVADADLTDQGQVLYRLGQLDRIPADDRAEVVAELRGGR